MQKLHCRPDGCVCRGQQGEIEMMHLPPGKRISVEILVGVGRTVASKSSIVGLYVGARGAWHSNLTNIPLIWSVSYFNLGGLEFCFGGAKPTKALPVTTGLGVGLQEWCAVTLKRFVVLQRAEMCKTIFIVFVTLSNLKKTSNRAVNHTSYKTYENWCFLL